MAEQRLIDANAFKENMFKYAAPEMVWDMADIIHKIDEMPSAQPEPQWIPCSERLPKPFEFCLWTTTDGRVVYHHCDGMFSKYTAWMPLPEPWRGEEHEDK